MSPTYGGIAHVTLPITDLLSAEAFYVGVLGAELRRRFDRETFLRLRPGREAEADADNSPLHLELGFGGPGELHLFVQRGHRPRAPAPHPHVAFEVTPAVLDEIAARLSSEGVPMDGPRRLGPPGHASLYFVDPFGHLLEATTMGYARAIPLGPPDVEALGRAFATKHDVA